MTFYKKIEEIRKAENLNKQMLSEILEIKPKTYSMALYRNTEPKGELLGKICNKFPEYTLWLMTDIVNPEGGQISPKIKIQARDLDLETAQGVGS